MKKIYLIFFSFSLLLGLFWMLPKNNFLTSNTINNVYNTQTCTSVSQYGITWTFDRAYTCGQFVNGDWWVVGPVKITAITSSISTITGAQINIIPTGMPRDDKTNFQDQGLIKFRGKGLTDLSNAKGFRYSASKDLTTQLPYIIPNNSSVITGLHTSDPWVDVKVAFRDIAILTVLDTIPRQGSFRPPYAGTNKPIWNESDLNYSALKNLDANNSALPDVEILIKSTQRPVLDFVADYVNSDVKNYSLNTNDYPLIKKYGREIASISGLSGLLLNTSDISSDQKRRLAINMVQWGIDIYGLHSSGMIWIPNGGHNHGRFTPFYLAGKLLNDQNILNALRQAGTQEKGQHFYVSQNDINYQGRVHGDYLQTDLNIPEWSSDWNLCGADCSPAAARKSAGKKWNDGVQYRFVNGGVNAAQVLTVLLMENNNLSQAKQVTAHNAFFDYMVTRYYPTEKGKHAKSFNSNNIHSLTFDLWERYLNGSLPSTPPTTPPSTPPPATPTTYTLTTTATNGTITRSPNQTSYTDGTIVTLTASANSGYQFSGWSGACSGTSTTCTVSITGAQNAIANFVSQTTSDITNISVTNSVKKGGTYPITVTYSSTDNKQIILEFKKANSPLQKIRLNLVPGTNQTVTTNIQIPDTTDVQEGQMHHFVAYITPSDTTSNEWDAREDFMIQGNILVLNNDSSERVCRPWN